MREAKTRMVSELAATQQLQKISTQLIQENDVGALYQQILNAAVGIMRSDFASMQMLYPERGELRLLAYKGFDPAAAAFWEWVSPGSGSTCGDAILTGERSIVVDVDLSELMAGRRTSRSLVKQVSGPCSPRLSSRALVACLA